LLGINGSSRRRAGIAAGVVLAGGLAGSALLAPASAFAGVMQVATTTSITGTHQYGSTLEVSVSVASPGGSPLAPAGSVKVSIPGGASCTTGLTLPSSASDLTSTGSCNLSGLAGGHYQLNAAYSPSSMQFGPSKAGGYWVSVSGGHRAALSESLYCPQQVTTGQRGTCTLKVTDSGWNRANGVSASIVLPSGLSARGCSVSNSYSGSGHPWGWQPCSVNGNTARAGLGNIAPGQTKELSVTFTGHLSSWQQSHGRMDRVTVHGYAWDNAASLSAKAAVTIRPRIYW
jgi:hypothetical protein